MKIFFLIVLVFAACTRDNNSAAISNTDLIVNKKWKISAISGKTSTGTMIADDYSNLPGYDKDDYWYFKPDLTFTYNANVEKEPGEPADILDYGKWSLTNGDTYLQLTSTMPQPPGQTTTYFPTKILELTGSSLKLESTDPTSGTIIWTNYIVIP